MTRTELSKVRERVRADEFDRWKSLVSQGIGVDQFRDDPVGNKWLQKPDLLQPSRFLQALKFRTNTAPNKGTLARARMVEDVSCRRCTRGGLQGQPETLPHILGQCPFTKDEWVNRHNDIVRLLDGSLRKAGKTVVMEEPIQTQTGVLKPDLVVHDQRRGHVSIVDVAVRFENYLEAAGNEKVQKYTPLVPLLTTRFGAQKVEVVPICIGARGAMPKSTRASLKALGISGQDQLTLALSVLRSSLEMFAFFMDGYRRRRRRVVTR